MKKKEEEGFAIENFCVWGGEVQKSGQATPMGGPRKQFELLPRKDTWVASKKGQAGRWSVRSSEGEEQEEGGKSRKFLYVVSLAANSVLDVKACNRKKCMTKKIDMPNLTESSAGDSE